MISFINSLDQDQARQCQARSLSLLFRQKKKIPVFRVTQPYLNLLMIPRIFFQVFWEKKFAHRHTLEKKNILCILKGEMPFKIHKI